MKKYFALVLASLFFSPLFSQENNFQFLKNSKIGMSYQIGSYFVKSPAAGNFEVWGYKLGVEYNSKFSKHFGATVFVHAGAGDTFNEENPWRYISGGQRGAGLTVFADVLDPSKRLKIKLSIGAVYNQITFHGDKKPNSLTWEYDDDFYVDRDVFNAIGSFEVGYTLPKGVTINFKGSLAPPIADFHYGLVGISISKKI